MSSSTYPPEFIQQLEAIQQRLVTLYHRIDVEINLALRSELAIELETIRQMVEAIQGLQVSEPITQLQRSLQEKDLLLREIHHRVRNNFQIVLSLLDIQALQSNDPGIQALLRDNQNRIRSIAMVHEKLYQSEQLATVNLGEYVQELAEILVQSYTIHQHPVVLRAEIDADVSIKTDRVMLIGLILNELITNAFKHGVGNHPGEIVLILKLMPSQQAILSVSNPKKPGQWGTPSEGVEVRSFGLQLVRNLLEQIDGELSYPSDHSETTPENINRIQVSFAVSN